MKTEILLINPPYMQTPGKWKAIYTEPPLGLAYLASYAREHNKNINIHILDAATMQLNLDQILNVIYHQKPDIIGCTTVTFTANFIKKLLHQTKRMYPDTLTIAGGAHPTALPLDMLKDIDISVIGEGEITFSELITARQNGEDYIQITGIAYEKDGEFVISPSRKNIENLNYLPYPAWDLLEHYHYSHQYPYKTKNNRYATIITARGCPFHCNFCGVKNMWGNKVRYRSSTDVLGEIKHLSEQYKVSFLYFFDDTFTTNRKRVIELCWGIREIDPDIKWACFSRVNLLDEDLLYIMKECGCVELQLGVESGNDKILEKIKKGITKEEAVKAFALTKKVGINTKGFFMIGNEGETEKSVNDTINFALKLDPTYGFFSVLIPFPGLPAYDNLHKKGYINSYNWDNYNWYGYPVFSTPLLSASKMKTLQRKAEIRFYLRLNKIIQYAWQTIRAGKIKTLLRNILSFVNIITFKEAK